jgi:hypothetical protein
LLGSRLLAEPTQRRHAGRTALQRQLSARKTSLVLGERAHRKRRLTIPKRLLRLFQQSCLFGQRRQRAR